MRAWSELSVSSRFNRLMGIGLFGPILLGPLANVFPNSPLSFIVFLVFLVTIPSVAARLRRPRCHEIVTTWHQQPVVKKATYRSYWAANLWSRLIPPRACPHCGLSTKYAWGHPVE